jgi:ABC-2 type transport system permease protein
MSGARQTWLVAARELRERGRSRAFLVTLVLVLVGVAAAIALPALLESRAGTKDVGLTGTVPAELAHVVQAHGAAAGTTVRAHEYATVAAGEEAVRDGDVDLLVVDARRLEWRERADEQLKAIVAGAIQLVELRERAVAAGIDPEELAVVLEAVPLTDVELGRITGRSPDDETAAFIMNLVLFGAITTYGAMVLSGVVEEKSSRTVEVLLARVPARSLLAGKIAGIGLLGLAQVVATVAVALVAAAVVDSIDLPAVRGAVMAWAVVWFVLGYALYATVFGTLGSLASRTEDASSVTGPVSIVLVLAFFVSFASIGSVGTTWARVVSWFPLTAPLAMPNRVAMGAATWWDPLVAVVLTLGAIAALVVAGGRVYTRAILHTGVTLSLAEAWRGAPVPAGRVTSEPDTVGGAAPTVAATRTTAHEATDLRPRAVPAAVGLVSGGAVLALTRDVVMSLAVAAGLYALGTRLMKPMGHGHGGQPRTPASS